MDSSKRLLIIGFCTLFLSLAFNVTAIFLKNNATLLPYFLIAGLALVVVSVFLFLKASKPELLRLNKKEEVKEEVQEPDAE